MNGTHDKLALYHAMLRIRLVELRIEASYHLDEMKTPIHLCIGQEAIAVGVCAPLTAADYVSSTHRSHGHYLAKGGDLKAMMAELYCRATGCSKGRGGSMHLADPAVGFMGSSSIVGGGLPLAIGMAFALAYQRRPRVSVVFFGDGAADEGALYESVNFAMLKRLPAIFVYENNQYSVCSPVAARQVEPLVYHYLPADRLPTCRIDGNDVLTVQAATETAVARARRGEGPSLIECRTYRMRGHAGSGSDVKLGYRSEAEVQAWEARCPVRVCADRLRAEGLLTDAVQATLTREIEAEIDAAVAYAQASPLPAPEDVRQFVFKE